MFPERKDSKYRMKYRLNKIKRGAWYIYRMDDLEELYKPFLGFYRSAILPECGDMRTFTFIYNRRKKAVRIKSGFKSRKFDLTNQYMAEKVYMMFGALTTTGLVSVPFYKVKIKVSAKGEPLHKESVMICKGGISAKTGLYSLRGVLV